MRQIKDLKIKYKLIGIIISTTLIAIIIAFSSAAFIYRHILRDSLIDEFSPILNVTANGMISILEFAQQKEAIEELNKILNRLTDVSDSFVFKEDKLFAEYHRPGKKPMDPPKLIIQSTPLTQFVGKYLYVFHPVIYKDKRCGTLFVRFSTEKMNRSINNLMIVMGVIILISFPLAFLLALKLQGIISRPILELVQATKQVSSEGNYSIRVQKISNDEIGMLNDSFNNMMEQIYNRDIHRDKVENELKVAEFFLTNIMESMPSALITIDHNGIISHWNNSAVQLTGIDAPEAKGKNLWEVIPGLEKYESTINNVLQTKKTVQFYRESIKIGSSAFFLNVIIFPLLESITPKFVIMINNVTEIELKEQQLRQSQKMETVGTLAGGLAHDFNNVLGGIIGTISLYKYKISMNRKVSNDEIEKYFSTIEDSANRASDLVQHLLSLTRKQELSFAPTNLNNIIKNTIKICKNTFDKSIDINAAFAYENAMTNADSTQIEQSLLNLCINASHAMTIMRKEGEPVGGKLTIKLDKRSVDKHFLDLHPGNELEEFYWRISVQDTGIGMSSQTLTKIFDPFFTTKTDGKGTGLGLAMVYNIIKQHKGYIDVYSQEGIGTTFAIYLSILRSETGEKSVIVTQEEIMQGEGLILVVDDEEVMRNTAKSILEECGYDVLLTRDGEEGVKVYKQYKEKIRAVVMDMVMPKMSGKQAYLEMKKIDKDVKVLLASGFKQDARVESILELGVKDFIQKPFTLGKLANSLNRVLLKG